MEPLFPPGWFAAGVVTDESARYFAKLAEKAPAFPVRHWRWAAFRDWCEEREQLTAEQCFAVYMLGEADPDVNLGTAMMCHTLLCRRCPPELRTRAAESERAAVRRTVLLVSGAA